MMKKLTKMLVAALLCLVMALPAFGAIFYVTPEGAGNNDGTSWANAATLQNLLNYVAKDKDTEIWVKAGTYKLVTSRDSVVIKGGVKLYGGFAGTESKLEERNWRKNETILAGSDNHTGAPVVIVSKDVTDAVSMDGFTVTGGKHFSDGALSLPSGLNAPVSVANCVFDGNSYGILARTTAFTVENCAFINNSSTGIYVTASAQVYVSNSTFSKNLAGVVGTDKSAVTVVSCTFSENGDETDTSAHNAGGIDFQNSLNPLTVVNSIFWGNKANNKLDIKIWDNASGTISLHNNVWDPARAQFASGVVPKDNQSGDPKLLPFKTENTDKIYAYTLDSGSSAIDKGLAVGKHTIGTVDITVPAKDQLGNARPAAPALVNIGAWHGGGVVVESITLDKTTLTLAPKGTATLKATITPDAAKDAVVTWSSDKPEIASVDKTGLVTAVAVGTATITASAGEKNATCAVTVAESPGPDPTPGPEPTDVKISRTTLSLSVGSSAGLKLTVTPSNADASAAWKSSNEAAATVVDGVVTAKATGNATITATMTTGGKTVTCDVTVTPQAAKPVAKEPKLPAGTSSEIKATKPVLTEVPINATPEEKQKKMEEAASTMVGITAADLEVSIHGQVTANSKASFRMAEEAVAKISTAVSVDTVLPLPVFTAQPGKSGGIVAVEFVLKGAEFKNGTPDKVRVMKVLSGGKGEFFGYQSDAAKFDDRTFTVQDMDDATFTGTFDKDKEYQLILFVKDGANFDVDGVTNTSVTDPAVVVGTNEVSGPTPTPSPLRGPSSSGGCNTGFGALALLALALLALAPLARRK